MSIKHRLAQLEKVRPQARGVEHMTPGAILARAETLIQQGATVTDEQRRALDSIRLAVTHEQLTQQG